MTWRKHFTQVDNSGLPVNITSRAKAPAVTSALTSRFNNWLPEIYAGCPGRLMRYGQYDQMDQDSEINFALDTIAEFATQPDEISDLPFEIKFVEPPGDTESAILETTLRQWCSVNKFQKRAFRIFRNTVKYGDQFFIRDPQTFELMWIDPTNVDKIIVNESEGRKIEAYYIKNLSPNFAAQAATLANPAQKPTGGSYSFNGVSIAGASNNIQAVGTNKGTDEGVPVSAKHIVHLSLTEGLDLAWPFGGSILEPVFKVFKQKELLEDSIIIYRVHRAPERRVFTIDTGNMPPYKAAQHLEQIRYEVQQKRIPNKNAMGNNVMDAGYSPMSMLEDYFFSATSDGRGSKVDTLPGGENLNQIDDMKFFNNKLLRGLRIPSSYMPTGPDDGTATFNDGKVGVAYIQEFRFAKYVERLQTQIADELDFEFKMFLKHRGVELDNSTFSISFNKPMNFSSYKELQVDAERAGLFGQLRDVPYLSKQFVLKKYLGLTDTEIKENERLWQAENKDAADAGPDQDNSDLGMPGMPGIRPAPGFDVDPMTPDMGALDDMGQDPAAGGMMPGQAGGMNMPAGPGPAGTQNNQGGF